MNYKVNIDPELEDIVPIFLSNMEKNLDQLQKAITNADFETSRTIGHNMKGSGGGYGFDLVTDIGMKIEEAAKAQDEKTIKDGLATLIDYMKNVEISYG